MKHLFFLLTLLFCQPLTAQRSDFMRKEALMPLVERLTAFGRTIPQEKVYVHMDNTCYFQGDTIWFAAYTRQTTDDLPSRVSGVLYVELLNQDGYLVERKLIEMKEGRGNGFFALNNQIQYSGFYELRAYTRWQLNWGAYEMSDKEMVYRTALERVQKNQRPHDRDHQRKHIGHPVQTEIDRKPAGKAIDGHRIAAHKERGCPDAGRRSARNSFTPDPSARHILYGSHQHCKSARERQQYGNQQKQRAQDPSPPAYMINKPIRDQIPGSKFRFHEPFPDLSGLRLRIQGCRQKYFQKGRPAKSSRRE